MPASRIVNILVDIPVIRSYRSPAMNATPSKESPGKTYKIPPEIKRADREHAIQKREAKKYGWNFHRRKPSEIYLEARRKLDHPNSTLKRLLGALYGPTTGIGQAFCALCPLRTGQIVSACSTLPGDVPAKPCAGTVVPPRGRKRGSPHQSACPASGSSDAAPRQVRSISRRSQKQTRSRK
jgi:hypothetical protein